MIIGITGFSGSGKTYFSCKLEKAISSVVVIQQDNYYKGCSSNLAKDYNFDSLEAIDVEKLFNDIIELKRGKSIKIPKYDFKKHRRVGYYMVEPKDVILLEGHLIFLDEKIRKLTDLLVFLEVDVDLALVRRIKRDLTCRGRDVFEVIERYEKFVARVHQELNSLKKKSDLIIPYSKDNEKAVEIIATFVKMKKRIR
jgi:uridine kinase